MRLNSFPLACLATFSLVSSANAQTGSSIPLSAMRSMSVPGDAAKRAYIVQPDGSRTEDANPPTLRFRTDVLKTQETVDSLLGRHNLVKDENTLLMLKALNPQFDTSANFLRAGSRVDIFSVAGDSAAPARYTFDSGNLARFAFTSKSLQAEANLKVAKQMQPSAFITTDLGERHLQSIESLKTASKILEAKADRLSRLDYAVAQYQIEYANKLVARVNERAAAGTLTNDEVIVSVSNANKAATIGEKAEAGLPVTGRRLVNVNVYKSDGNQHASELGVYIVPAGVLNYDFGQARVEEYLDYFSFSQDASPVSQEVATDFEPRMCIGPKNSTAAMARLIRDRRLSTCRRLDFAASGALTMTFRSPQDVAKP